MDNAQFFYRNAIFTRRNGQIGLADINQPDQVTPLDDWLGTVVSLADGRHSIQELIEYLSGKYPQPPTNLEQTIHSVIERLQEGDLVKLSERPVELPYYLAAPIEDLELTVARQKIREDGYDSGRGNLV